MIDDVVDRSGDVVVVEFSAKGLARQRRAMIIVAQRAGCATLPSAMPGIAVIVASDRAGCPERTMSGMGSKPRRSRHRQTHRRDTWAQPISTVGLPTTITPPCTVISVLRAAGLPEVSTVALPLAM